VRVRRVRVGNDRIIRLERTPPARRLSQHDPPVYFAYVAYVAYVAYAADRLMMAGQRGMPREI
jgi:hypothetical protein